jgi:hypothetical protein
MTQSVVEMLESAKALRRDEVADLAYELLRVLDGDSEPTDQASVDAAWRAEYRRRVDDIEAGRVQLVPHAETVAQARAMLTARRK